MITDPYFLGVALAESPTPWHWLARINQAVPFATQVVRLTLSMAGVLVSLTYIFSLSPLFFATILPSIIDISKITKAPLLEPTLYPPYWYPLTTSVMSTGLAGFWGKFWHQMFRFGISEPSRVLIKEAGYGRAEHCCESHPASGSVRIVRLHPCPRQLYGLLTPGVSPVFRTILVLHFPGVWCIRAVVSRQNFAQGDARDQISALGHWSVGECGDCFGLSLLHRSITSR